MIKNFLLMASLLALSCCNTETKKIEEAVITDQSYDVPDSLKSVFSDGKEREIVDTFIYKNSSAKIVATILEKDRSSCITKIKISTASPENITVKHYFDQVSRYQLDGANVMDVDGRIEFSKTTNNSLDMSIRTFVVNSKGKIFKDDKRELGKENFAKTEKDDFDDIIAKIKASEEYKVAYKNPGRETSSVAIKYILYKSGLTPYFNSLGEIMTNKLNDYNNKLELIDEKLNGKNTPSVEIQNAGSDLKHEFESLIIKGQIGNKNFDENLKRLTDLVINITIPIAK